MIFKLSQKFWLVISLFLLPILLITMLINFANIQKALLPLVEKQFPDGLFQVHGLGETKIVILTIDDGLSSRSMEILDLLDEFDAKASFFLHKSNTKTISNSQDVLDRILKQGHEIGNHMPEDIPSISLSNQEFDRQFREADLFLRSLGIKPRFFRASGGYFNRETMMPLLTELNYENKFIMASFLPWDTHLPFPNIYANQLINGVFPGAIVVFHDGEQKGDKRLTRTFISLRKFLGGMKEKEYQVVSLSEALEIAKNNLPKINIDK